MMQGSSLRKNLRAGRPVYGTHLVSYGNPFGASMLSKLDLDFVFICTEHIPIDRTEVSQMCHTYRAMGISPMVRIPYPCPRLASMYLDGGAEGIVAPYVETLQEVRDLVGAVRYRPLKGEQLQEYLDGTRKPNPEMRSFFERFNGDRYLIIGIESVPAIRRLDELLAFEDVDGVFLGPHDITCSMEIPEQYDHPDFVATITDVIRRCRQHGKGVGIHMDQTSPQCQRYQAAGANFLLDSADVVKMMGPLKSGASQLREVTAIDRVHEPMIDGANPASCILPIDLSKGESA